MILHLLVGTVSMYVHQGFSRNYFQGGGDQDFKLRGASLVSRLSCVFVDELIIAHLGKAPKKTLYMLVDSCDIL